MVLVLLQPSDMLSSTVAVVTSKYNTTKISFCLQHLLDREHRVVCENVISGVAPVVMALAGLPLAIETQNTYDYTLNGTVFSELRNGKFQMYV